MAGFRWIETLGPRIAKLRIGSYLRSFPEAGKASEDRRVMSKARVAAVGVNASGYRAVPGLAVGPIEASTPVRVRISRGSTTRVGLRLSGQPLAAAADLRP